MKKVKISAVSYLNTLPFMYGIAKNNRLKELVDISTDYPALCAKKLKENEVDIGLVPIAILPELPDYQIISDYCIATNGNVKSVILVSAVPLSEIETIILDYQSRTSIMLAKILAENFWKISPNWQHGQPNYINNITGKTAGVIIGDRALEHYKNYEYVYDLSAEWKKMTSLPFVFATWTANKDISPEIVAELNKTHEFGLKNIKQAIEFFRADIENINYNHYEYLTENIDYQIDTNKKKAIEKYLYYLKLIKN